MREVRPVTTGAAHGSGRLVLDAAARKLATFFSTTTTASLHYRSPTEGGSSGSPVSDDEWRLIGLHHAGGTGMPQLNEAGSTYAANEGITIDAIRGGLAHRPPECSPL